LRTGKSEVSLLVLIDAFSPSEAVAGSVSVLLADAGISGVSDVLYIDIHA
jgi:hypothetical protein